LREYPFGVDECLGATETHETDARCTGSRACGGADASLGSGGHFANPLTRAG
jgi:hypothetical protein